MTTTRATDGPASPAVAWRHDDVTTICPACGRGFEPIGRRRWCSDACRAASYRRRKNATEPIVVLPVPQPRRPRTVYACETCGARSLGSQFCEECRTFMNRVGIGAPCPFCEEPVAAIELVPEAVERRA